MRSFVAYVVVAPATFIGLMWAYVVTVVEHFPESDGGGILIAFAAGGAIYGAKEAARRFVQGGRNYKKQHALDRKIIAARVDVHQAALLRNLDAAVGYDDYNRIVRDQREEVVFDFLRGYKMPETLDLKSASEIVLRTLHDAILEAEEYEIDLQKVPIDGYAFEHWIAAAFQKRGWQAKATTGSGDQGVDVIAEKSGCRVGIQCKRYTGSVGNKAVQEAISGRIYHGLDKAAVLTNTSFTRSAVELARRSDVTLMTTHDLLDPDRHLLRTV